MTLTGFVHRADHISGVYFDGDQSDDFQPVYFFQIAPDRVRELGQRFRLAFADFPQRSPAAGRFRVRQRHRAVGGPLDLKKATTVRQQNKEEEEEEEE